MVQARAGTFWVTVRTARACTDDFSGWAGPPSSRNRASLLSGARNSRTSGWSPACRRAVAHG